jgi:hypothetical protein
VRAKNSLAALLSLLLISTPVSTWACDLACTLHQAHPDCHNVGSPTTSKDDMAMSMSMPMPSGMDMGSDQSESPAGPDTAMGAAPGQAMPMFPQQEVATPRSTQPSEQGSEPGMRTGAAPDYSKGMSSCTHETCVQVSATVSPPGADQSRAKSSRTNSLHQAPVSISSFVDLWAGFHWVQLGSPPPRPLTVDRLITTLRI